MKRKSYNKIFKDINKLQEMLHMHSIQEKSISEIARHFGVDHTSILYQIKKHNENPVKRKYVTRKKTGNFCPICEMKMDSKYHTVPCK